MLDAAATEESPPDTATSATSTESYKVGVEDKTCFKCGKVMQSRGALRLHLDRVYPCDMMKEERPRMAAPGDGATTTCNKCGKTFKTRNGLRLHVLKLTCDAPEVQAEMIRQHKESNRRGNKTCPKCHVTFSSGQGLRYHLNRVTPCDPNRSFTLEKQEKQDYQGDKTCPKCHVTFSSRQSLRLHVTRVIPCDAIKPSNSTPVSAFKCLKCQKIFSSSLKLRLHRNRQLSCDNVEPKQLNEGLIKTVTLSKSQAKGSLDEYLSMLGKKQRQPQQKHCQTSSDIADDENAKAAATIAASSSQCFTRKRSIDDSREEMSPISESIKRTRSETGSFAILSAQLSKRDPSPEPTQNKENERKTEHGGNILTDGCCCRKCVREWTRTMMKRLECLDDEVTTLRLLVKRGDNTPNVTKDVTKALPSEQAIADPNLKVKNELDANPEDPKDVTKHSNNQQQDIQSQSKPDPHARSIATNSTSKLLPVKPLEIALIEKYNHLNDQIITNERALEDSLAFLKEISQHDGTSTNSSELRTQLNELRIFIDVEKNKRDEAVATIIVQRWNTKRAEFRLLLENMAVKSKPNAEKAFHEDCAEIASQLEEKYKILAKLGGLIGTVGLNADQCSTSAMDGKIPKYAVETTAKSFLERQRDDIIMCLLRSSPRIYLLTKEKLPK
ncbi:hypothetical protein PHMEG_00010874 [Phytophthora megakarya]|uniref:C2H2-type domain-containing protein n=1 Tax=Phytophthora megakarya TaxID=4795 RepID=A0A225WEM1_9STRA|nr:hypothetical protein PHMEG_00010874 [Phytophthora megakarya]